MQNELVGAERVDAQEQRRVVAEFHERSREGGDLRVGAPDLRSREAHAGHAPHTFAHASA